MKIIQPKDANLVLTPPEGCAENVVPLHVFTCAEKGHSRQTYSLWEPNEEERLALMMGLPIMICILGDQFPPMAVGVAKELDTVTQGFI